MTKLTFTFFAFLLSMAIGLAQPGTPDLNFDADGALTIDFFGSNDFGYTIAPYGNDFIVAGITDSPGTRFGAFARLNGDGSYDTQFANTGKRAVNVPGGQAEISGLAVQNDNRIIAVGSTGSLDHGLIFRLNPNGSVDGGFGGGFIQHQQAGNDVEYYYGVALQPDGKIVVCGTTGIVNTRDVIVLRLNTNGTMDSTFAGDGIAITDLGVPNDYSNEVLIQPDGKILVVGSSGDNVLLLRYNSDGTLDNSFSFDGKVTTDMGYSDDGFDLALQPDGKVLVAGRSYNAPANVAFVLRYNSDGTLDNSFGQNGIVDTVLENGSQAFTILLQPDGKILAGGEMRNAQNKSKMLLFRLNADGSFDNSFGQSGIFISSFTAGDESIYEMCFLQDGRIATNGFTGLSGSYNMISAVITTGINVGLVDVSAGQRPVLAYPNPVHNQFELAFELAQPGALSIELTDLSGRTVATFAANQPYEAGKYNQTFELPGTLANGNYLLRLHTETGSSAIHIQVNQ